MQVPVIPGRVNPHAAQAAVPVTDPWPLWAVLLCRLVRWCSRHPGTVQCIVLLGLLFLLISVYAAPMDFGYIEVPRPSEENYFF